MFRGFLRPRALLTRIFPSRTSTQTEVDWGEPSGFTVARCQKFGSSRRFRTFSGSSIGAPFECGSGRYTSQFTQYPAPGSPESAASGGRDGLGHLGRELGEVEIGRSEEKDTLKYTGRRGEIQRGRPS